MVALAEELVGDLAGAVQVLTSAWLHEPTRGFELT